MNAILETLIGLVLLYFLLSLLCSALVEYWATWAKSRATVLKEALVKTLGQTTTEAVLAHALIANLTSDVSRLQYIPPDLFAQALLNLDAAAVTGKAGSVLKALSASPAVTPHAPATQIQALSGEIERWFEATMERWSGLYKRKAQLFSMVAAVIVVCSLNIDTVHIGRTLWESPIQRAALVQQATGFVSADPAAQKVILSKLTTKEQIQASLDVLNLPIGWTGPFTLSLPTILEKLLGLLLSVIAVGAGAPFWFGLLNRLVKLRLSGEPPTSTQKST